MTETKKDKRIEWVCRILITLQLVLVIRGYIAFLQAQYQFDSPLIPRRFAYQIAHPYVLASLISSGFMLISLWLYFINKRIASIITGSISLLLSEFWVHQLIIRT